MLLWTKHLRADQPSCKLSNPLAGLFRVEAMVSNRAYCLLLPAAWRVHLVFHIQMLELYPNRARESADAPQSKTLINDYEDFEIEGILDSC